MNDDPGAFAETPAHLNQNEDVVSSIQNNMRKTITTEIPLSSNLR